MAMLLARIKRVLKHISTSKGAISRTLGNNLSERVARRIRESELQHTGQIVVVIESALEPLEVWQGKSGAERATEVFSERRVWDTEQNNGVLLYLLLADRDIEILADRGLSKHVSQDEWHQVCSKLEAELRAGAYLQGIEGAIDEITRHLRTHFPRSGQDQGDGEANELSNEPVIR